MPPVEDKPVHELTRIGSDWHPACYNAHRPPEGARYAVSVRNYYATGEFAIRQAWVENTMSKNCRQVGQYLNGEWHDLPECVGCTATKDTEYINTMRGLR